MSSAIAKFIRLRVLRDPEPDACNGLAERVAALLALDPAEIPASVWIGEGTPPISARDQVAVRKNADGTIYGIGIYTGDNARASGCCTQDGWQWLIAQDAYRIQPCDATLPEGFRDLGFQIVEVEAVELALTKIQSALAELRDWVSTLNDDATPPAELTLALSAVATAIDDLGNNCMTVIQNEAL